MNTNISARQQRLLVFLGAGQDILDPIRIMKGMFIFEMKAPSAWVLDETKYNFVPYNYGPFSPQVYSDLETLHEMGYVSIQQAQNRSWNYYSLTDEGQEESEAVITQMDTRMVDYLKSLRGFVSAVSFRQLLESVYTEFPDFAVNSVFK